MTGDSATSAVRKRRLVEIVRARSFQSGPEITLASGKKSTIYFNMKPTIMHPEGAHLVASLMLDALDGADVDLVGGLELGAVPIAAAVTSVSHARGRPIQAFFIRKEAKAHGTKNLVEGLAAGETLAGRKAVIVEDVTTTGGSAIKAAEAVRAAGGDVVRVLTILDREEGAAEAFAAAGLTLTALMTAGEVLGWTPNPS